MRLIERVCEDGRLEVSVGSGFEHLILRQTAGTGGGMECFHPDLPTVQRVVECSASRDGLHIITDAGTAVNVYFDSGVMVHWPDIEDQIRDLFIGSPRLLDLVR